MGTSGSFRRVRFCAQPAAAALGVGLFGLIVSCSDKSSSPSGDGGGSPSPRWAAAVGSAGTFVQTFDDVTWTERAITTRDFFAVTCVGNFDGWAAGAAGAVAHTLDGGKTWTWQDAHTTASLRAIRFGSSTLGLVAGDAGTIAVTSDGGSTWRTVAPTTGVTLRAAAFAGSAGVMLAGGDGGVALRSTDGGADWSVSSFEGAGAADIEGMASDPGAHLVLAVDSAGSVWSSVDAGSHFVRAASAGAPLYAVSMTDDGTLAIAAGAHGTVLERAADGSWRASAAPTTANLHAALVRSDQGSIVYVAGDSGTLLGSSSGGAGWRRVPLATSATLFALDDL